MNTNGNPQVVYGLDAFLDVLKTNRFQVGLDRRLRLLQALDGWQGSFEPYRLRTLLCPLFATTAEEQRLFYDLFETHFPHFKFPSHVDDQPVPRVDPYVIAPGNSEPSGYIYWTLGLLLLFTFTALTLTVLRLRDPGPPPPLYGLSPIAPAWSLKSPFQPPTKELAPPPPPPPPADFSDWRPAASSHPYAEVRRPSISWLWSFLLLLPMLFWSFAEFLAWLRRRAILVRATGQEFGLLPRRLPLKIIANVSGGVVVALPSLRRPSPGPRRLHLPKTVYATVRAGFPQFRYEPIFRRPEYLVLIDKVSVRDHQAILFEELVKELDRRGLRVSAYFFSGDPRVCRALANGRTHYLADLFHQAGEQRLIILAQGEKFISDEGDATAATSLLLRWPRRCILTPREPRDWRRHEFNLAHYFYLLPATPESLAASVDHFDPDQIQRLHSAKSGFDHTEPDFNHASPAEIRRSVGHEIYRWICACALYPHLQWDITLRLGNKLDPQLLNNSNIQKLIRLPWFRRGSMPLPLQQVLADSLGKRGRKPLREAILDVLNDARPMLDGSEDENHQLEIAVQQLDILPEERRQILGDETVARVVAAQKVPPSALAIPSTLRSILFPYGVPTLGFRQRIRRTLLFFGLLAVASISASAWLSVIRGSTGQIGFKVEIPAPPFWSQKSAVQGPPKIPFGQLLVTLNGHTASVRSAAFSPDGLLVVTASEDDTARVWNAANGQPKVILSGHTGIVFTAMFSSDGQRIVTASYDSTARVWNAVNGQLLATLKGHGGPVYTAVFSTDGQHIITSGFDATTRIWNAANGRLLATLSGQSDRVFTSMFSPDSQRIVTASGDTTAQVWNAANGKLVATLTDHAGSHVSAAAFSPDGQRIITASDTARVWDSASGKLLATLDSGAPVWSALFSPDSQRIITTGYDSTARLWNAPDGQLLATLSGGIGKVDGPVFSPDSQLIVTASNDSPKVWNVANGQQRATLTGHTATVWSAVFSRDGQRIVTASADHTVRVWNASHKQAPLRPQMTGSAAKPTSKKDILAAAREFHELNSRASLTPAENRTLNEDTNNLTLANSAAQQFFESLSKEFSQATIQSTKDSSSALQAALRPGEVAIYTLLSEKRTHLLLITPDAMVARETSIDAATLKRKLFAFRESLTQRNSEFRPAAEELYHILLGPIDSDLEAANARTLIWELDGALRYIPLAALYDGKSFLVEKYSLAILTPAAMPHLSERPSKPGRTIIFGVSKNEAPGFSALPGVAIETKAIQAITGGTLVLDDLFTLESFEQQLSGQYSIVHLATHAIIDPNIEKSFILLGDGHHLTFEEIKDNPNLSFRGVDLLVMSACDAEVLPTGNGVEIEGFSILIQQKGAKSVVDALWSIDDVSTSIMMPAFYKFLLRGATKADALRQAQLELMKDNRYAHPYYWAPFVLSGNWQ
jgi:WD40 repeat protein/CHAT domain-containing protein